MDYQKTREILLENFDSYGYRMELALRNKRDPWEKDPDMINRYIGQARGWGKVLVGINEVCLNVAITPEKAAEFIETELDTVLRLRASTKAWYETDPQDREILWQALGEIEVYNQVEEEYGALLKGEN